MKRALVIVDMQNDFVNGLLGTKEAQAIVPNILTKISDYREKYIDIYFTRDTHKSNYLYTEEGKYLPTIHCEENTVGWEIIKEFGKFTNRARIIDDIKDVIQREEINIINKPTFGSSLLCSTLTHNCYNEVEFVGVCTDICVISNALGLKMYNPEVHVKVDARCCAGTTPEKHKAALEVMESCLIEITGDKKWKCEI